MIKNSPAHSASWIPSYSPFSPFGPFFINLRGRQAQKLTPLVNSHTSSCSDSSFSPFASKAYTKDWVAATRCVCRAGIGVSHVCTRSEDNMHQVSVEVILTKGGVAVRGMCVFLVSVTEGRVSASVCTLI